MVVTISISEDIITCTDPESFVKRGSNSGNVFFDILTLSYSFRSIVCLVRGERIKIQLKAGFYRPASKMPLNVVSLVGR